MGIEPTSKAWEAFILPLNYTRMCRRLYGLNRLNVDPHARPNVLISLYSLARFCRYRPSSGALILNF